MNGNTRRKKKKVKVNPVNSTHQVNFKKQLTVHGCCGNINITNGTTTVMFASHRFEINVVHCKACGSVKATSSIKHIKER